MSESVELRKAAEAQDAAAVDAAEHGFNYLAHAHRDMARMLRNQAEQIENEDVHVSKEHPE